MQRKYSFIAASGEQQLAKNYKVLNIFSFG